MHLHNARHAQHGVVAPDGLDDAVCCVVGLQDGQQPGEASLYTIKHASVDVVCVWYRRRRRV